MYKDIKTTLDEIENNPKTGNEGQQQHISVTAVLAKITIDLVSEMTQLKKTMVELDEQNDRLTKVTTVLSVVGIALAVIQVLPILIQLFQ